jgi:hypothetical protein
MFAVAPFGVKIMSGILQRTIEGLLSDLEVPPFLNNVAIALFTEENHITKVREVLCRLIYETVVY